MSLRFHEIAEERHRILNPFTEEQLALLGDICRLRAGCASWTCAAERARCCAAGRRATP
jgi:hypothetical protein